MFINKSSQTLFQEICDVFFQGNEEFYIQYFDSKGLLNLSDKAWDIIPTYLVHNKIGEVVIADSHLSLKNEMAGNDNTDQGMDLLFTDTARVKKIGILYKTDKSRFLKAKWIATEEMGIVKSEQENRDLHRDLSLIASCLGIKPDKIRVA